MPSTDKTNKKNKKKHSHHKQHMKKLTNIPAISRNGTAEMRWFDRIETEVALIGHFSDLFKHHLEKTGKYYGKIVHTSVNEPALQHIYCINEIRQP